MLTFRPLDIDIPDQLDSAANEMERTNWHHRLVLKPATMEVQLWSTYGNGVPVEIWENAVIQLGRVPDGVAGLDPVREALQSCEPELRELAALHELGGRYANPDRANDLSDQIDRHLDRAMESLRTIIDADEWLSPCSHYDLFPQQFIASDEAFAQLAAQIVAGEREVVVYQSDVERVLRARWADYCEELADDAA